ncbi:fimbrial protein [Enterobacter sp. ENT03]|uniref:fimbrial protein n=1 Tax=Enterobacter sp. ENT03 TaxID=2854780 RepID=UPI001C4918A1|nr:fimbrial protein [Enterobacter sp. ENT03]MBV7403496.1 fimbrial protein [Enterobacter sp. ENT03]
MNKSLITFLSCISLGIGLCISHNALAVTGWCASGSNTDKPGEGTPYQYIFEMEKTVTDVTQVEPGDTLQQGWHKNQNYTAWCDNTPGVKSVTYFKAQVGPGMVQAPDNQGFYYIPHTVETLSVQTYMDINSNGSLRVPFNNINNHAPDDHTKPAAKWGSGKSGHITIRVEKAIALSRIVIPPTIIAELWGSHTLDSYGTSPLVQVVVSGSIMVPQACIIKAGTSVTMELGASWAGDYSTLGEKPAGYTPVTTTIKAHCDNTLATEELNLGMHAPAAEGGFGAIKTNKAHLGIMLTAQSQHSVETRFRSDDPSIRVPFHLAENNGEATITLQAWPVKTTSDDITPGDYVGVAVLDIYIP